MLPWRTSLANAFRSPPCSHIWAQGRTALRAWMLLCCNLPALPNLRQNQCCPGRIGMIKIGAVLLDQGPTLPGVEALDELAVGNWHRVAFRAVPFFRRLYASNLLKLACPQGSQRYRSEAALVLA